MKNLILIIGDDLRINRPFLDYIFENYEKKFGVLDDIKFLRNRDKNTPLVLKNIIENSQNVTIFASKDSYMVCSKILATLNDDSIELNEQEILSPTTAIKTAPDSILIKIQDCLINLIKASPLENLPEILMHKENKRKSFFIFDFRADLIDNAMSEISTKHGVLTQTSPYSRYVTLIRAHQKDFGDLNGFLQEMRVRFDNMVILERNLAEFLVHKLRQLDMSVTFAESCTGGLCATKICENSGASDIFKGSLVTYSNEIKNIWLNVDEDILRRFGAVSKECVSDMLSGAMSSAGADFSVAISGIAGPGGGSERKPVGTIFIGAMDSSGEKIIEKHHLKGDRNYIRNESANIGFSLLLKLRPDLFF